MPRKIVISDDYVADFQHYAEWYAGEGGSFLALRFEVAVDETLGRLAANFDAGRNRRFRNPRLQGLRSVLIKEPFGRLVLFYRSDDKNVYLFRLIHGARNLPKRLLQPGDYE